VPDAPAHDPTSREGLPPVEEARAMLRRAEKGDEAALPTLRLVFGEKFERLPAIDVADLARRSACKPVGGGDVLVRELLLRRMDEVAAELAGPEPSAVERLLAERAAYCWHVVHTYERVYGESDVTTFRQDDYHQRRIGAAHRRYLSSLKALAAVRKLAAPTLQINIARRQVNVAGTSEAGASGASAGM
jgi:hypothetical protein